MSAIDPVLRPRPRPQPVDLDSDTRRLARQSMAEFIAREIAVTDAKPLAVLMVNLIRPRHFASLTRVSTWEMKLRNIDSRIARVLRPTDRYARLSDEKLCIVLPLLQTGAQAVIAAARMSSALQEPDDIDGRDLAVRSSIGISIWPDHGETADELVKSADMAAHIATETGDEFRVVQPEDRRALQRHDADSESRLLQAIRTNELTVHYQPQIEIATGRCTGAEALLRWAEHATWKMSTAVAIEIAEQGGLIGPLTIAVMNTVLRDAVKFRRSGVDLNLSINLSTRMLNDLELPDVIDQAISTWGVPPQSLTFEITESVMIGDIERSLVVLTRLRDLGVRLSIDDFGTGYSSLAYMKRFPVHELKIDKSFVLHMLDSKGDRQIVQSVIDLSHNFGLMVVAEGVEDEATFNELKAMGCDTAQGYYFSRAIPYNDVGPWISARNGSS